VGPSGFGRARQRRPVGGFFLWELFSGVFGAANLGKTLENRKKKQQLRGKKRIKRGEKQKEGGGGGGGGNGK